MTPAIGLAAFTACGATAASPGSTWATESCRTFPSVARHHCPTCTARPATHRAPTSVPAPTNTPAATPVSQPARPLASNSRLGGPNGPSPAPPPKRRSPRSPDYAVNVGAAIEALRVDYPELLSRAPQLGVYSSGIVFRDRPSGYRLVGKDAYSRLLWALRMQAGLCFSSAKVAIHSLYYDDDEGVVYLRWRLQGSTRVWGLVNPPPMVVIDAMSIYTMNSEGRICGHELDPTVPQKPRRLRPFVEEVLALGTIRVAPTLEPVATAGPRKSHPVWFKSLEEAVYVDMSGVSGRSQRKT